VYQLTGDGGALRQAAAPLHRRGLTHHMFQGHQLYRLDPDSNRSVDSDSNRLVDSDSNRSVDPDSKYGYRKVKMAPKM